METFDRKESKLERAIGKVVLADMRRLRFLGDISNVTILMNTLKDLQVSDSVMRDVYEHLTQAAMDGFHVQDFADDLYNETLRKIKYEHDMRTRRRWKDKKSMEYAVETFVHNKYLQLRECSYERMVPLRRHITLATKKLINIIETTLDPTGRIYDGNNCVREECDLEPQILAGEKKLPLDNPHGEFQYFSRLIVGYLIALQNRLVPSHLMPKGGSYLLSKAGVIPSSQDKE